MLSESSWRCPPYRSNFGVSTTSISATINGLALYDIVWISDGSFSGYWNQSGIGTGYNVTVSA
eukprot:4625431-Pyramimonas_sp.AAC.1